MRDLWEEAMDLCARGKHGAAFSPATACGECIDWALAEARGDGLGAAVACVEAERNAAESIGSMGHATTLGLALEALHALQDAPLPDTGWRSRHPTGEETKAHNAAHGPTGMWLVERTGGAIVPENGDTVRRAYFTFGGRKVSHFHRCRPVTRELFAAPWPEEETS